MFGNFNIKIQWVVNLPILVYWTLSIYDKHLIIFSAVFLGITLLIGIQSFIKMQSLQWKQGCPFNWRFEERKETNKTFKMECYATLGDFGGQQYIVAHCRSPPPFHASFCLSFLILHRIWFSMPVWFDVWQHKAQPRDGNKANQCVAKVFEKGKFPIWKIVGSPWKEGEIRLEVNKTDFNTGREDHYSYKQK